MVANAIMNSAFCPIETKYCYRHFRTPSALLRVWKLTHHFESKEEILCCTIIDLQILDFVQFTTGLGDSC